jgi:hypothetical protein
MESRVGQVFVVTSVVSVALVPAPVKLASPAGLSTRRLTAAPPLPDLSRQRTITPSIGDASPPAAVLDDGSVNCTNVHGMLQTLMFSEASPARLLPIVTAAELVAGTANAVATPASTAAASARARRRA